MIVLDTSALIELVTGTDKGSIIQEYLTEESGAISSLTVHEMLAGANNKRIAFLKSFFETLQIIPYGLKEAYISSDLEKQLAKKGKMINKLDILIAATCLVHEIPLITLDNDFTHVSNLKLILV